MLNLVNLSTYHYDLQRFNNNRQNILHFLEKNHIDGIELLNALGWKEEIIPKKNIKGAHLKNYPTWLDFWNNNQSALLEQFKDMDLVKKYYGGNRDDFIEHYRKEIEIANKIGVQYVVFHVSHVQVEHTYNYQFTYSDEEVIDGTATLINEIFKDLHTDVTLLFENLWWPGLRKLNKDLVIRLFNQVNYPNKGIMLDTGHLMNTNTSLESENQGIDYIINTVNNLGELKSLIKGVHLHCSLSGKYVLEQMSKNQDKDFVFSPISHEVFMHVFNIDNHKPFTSPKVKKLIELINPKYLIHELIASSSSELEKYIQAQMKALR
ncbi:TIM barrel protein [Crassaminicella profunda]|uniref:TIM barrel protein n=1 Tax=Crassaminicella profunda TaxID=1286698 RepID=UPI001CA6E5C4|nr:TIM barrel protein [Crassaminicella profunda]QZY55879.1 sugar phosphate isomerase/epimerase [Crassaminicella profunda]